MTDRDRLADALALATPEMLREDARVAANRALFEPHLPEAARELRLAGLALAIADAANTSDARIEQAGRADYLILDIPMPDTHTMGYGACELPAALAALLRAK